MRHHATAGADRLPAPPPSPSPKSRRRHAAVWGAWALLHLVLATTARGQADQPLVGVWVLDEGFQIAELTFRSDGHYQLHTRSTDPTLDLSSTERGRYQANGEDLTLTSFDYFGEPAGKAYKVQLAGDLLDLTTVEFPHTKTYQFKAGSREDVLARENVEPVLIGTWGRTVTFAGHYEYTFRPGGYYVRKYTPEGGGFPPEYLRGRYEQQGARLVLKPYSGLEAEHDIDFFGTTLTLIRRDAFSGESAGYERVPGSEAAVRAKAAEAAAFLARPDWQVGLWEIRDDFRNVDLTFRPDGYYSAANHGEFLRGLVRGRYTLEPGRIQFHPFVGQEPYARDNGDFGKVPRSRAIDFYDGELQFIDLDALSQTVILARKRPGSDTPVQEKVRQARLEREREGWHLGVWEVNDPVGWMEFTLRPDQRYIAQSGVNRVPGRVERGRYVVAENKITLAPYPGLGSARGFELDLYDGDLFLVGDLARMVVARKVAGSEAEVIGKTLDPDAMKGERGPILGRWSAHRPGEDAALVFRQDGEFRLTRCRNESISHDYGLYALDLASRTLVSDSRFVPVQTLGLDFYGDTLTLFGGHGAPSTYVVNLGTVDSDIQASHLADAEEALVDAQWLARVTVGPRDPTALPFPVAGLPEDPNPGRAFENATVFTSYRLYRRLLLGVVVFNTMGTVRTVTVTNTREWHFFPNGRVLIRFTNHRAGAVYPTTIEDVSDSWGAYRIEPKPAAQDVLHRYADNGLLLETDLGEQAAMTLEDGRRHLFWDKDYQILSEWAAEQKPIPCEAPPNPDGRLINTGIDLTTTIPPDPVGEPQSLRIALSGPVSGQFTLTGTADTPGEVVVERATRLATPIAWETLQTHTVAAGAFSLPVPQGNHPAAFFRVRRP